MTRLFDLHCHGLEADQKRQSVLAVRKNTSIQYFFQDFKLISLYKLSSIQHSLKSHKKRALFFTWYDTERQPDPSVNHKSNGTKPYLNNSWRFRNRLYYLLVSQMFSY